VFVLAGAVLVASACSLIVRFDPEGQSCGSGGECLAGYLCVDGTCWRASNVAENADRGSDAGFDAGYAFFEALLSNGQVDPPTADPSSGLAQVEYDYGANTLRWRISHDAGQPLYAVLHTGHPGWSGPAWQDAGYGAGEITGSMPVTDAGSLIEDLTRGHVYIALYDSTGYETIRGYIVEPGARIYVAALYDSMINSLVARAGFVVSADAGTLFYDATLEFKNEVVAADIHDYAGSVVQPTPWSGDKHGSSGVVIPPADRVVQLLDANQTYYEIDTALQAATGSIWKVK
jgi:hypothetical protein